MVLAKAILLGPPVPVIYTPNAPGVLKIVKPVVLPAPIPIIKIATSSLVAPVPIVAAKVVHPLAAPVVKYVQPW